MADESEQKSLPASEKKLRDARKKGQVSHSRDLVTGVTLTFLFLYLPLAGPAIVSRLKDLIIVVSQSVDRPFSEEASRSIQLSLDVIFLTVLPPTCIIVVGDILAGWVSTFGPVFSFEAVAPKFEHINPAQGLKRLFSIRNLVEFAKAAVKVVILATAFIVIMRGAIEPLFETPICGLGCVVTAAVDAVKPLIATAVVAFIAIGVFDLLVQRQLFLRDMRMTRTENKREVKDLEGDPLIRGERRRVRHQIATGRSVRVGIRHAVIAIMHGNRVVGLRYKPPETGVPMVVSKAEGEDGAAMIAEARQLGIPMADNAAFVAALAARHKVGDMIHPDLFEVAAQTLVAAGFS
jgi:type III secretion protein U